MDDILTIDNILTEGGLLTQQGYKFRLGQLEMARAIDDTIRTKSQLMIEAGTGTGKTFAYLIPAMLSQKKVVISTGTKNLQDQLINKDLPKLAQIIQRPLKVALLKGRNNYLCRHRIAIHQHESKFFSPQIKTDLHKINLWQNQTKYGDKSEIKFIPENAKVWPLVSSTRDNCLGQNCDFFKNCFVAKARRNAMNADILVINHYLFFADLALKENGFGELLPQVEVVIFDEAHQLPEIAGTFFGCTFSSRQALELANDLKVEVVNTPGIDSAILSNIEELKKNIANLRLSLGTEELSRKPWQQIASKSAVIHNLNALKTNFDCLEQKLKILTDASKGLHNMYERVIYLHELLNTITDDKPENTVQWYETFPKSFSLHLTPIEPAGEIQKLFIPEISWIFTSATLAVGDNFDFFANRLGLKQARSLKIESHYNYSKQATLHLPQNLPLPNEPDYIEKLVKRVLPIINRFAGRTFFLFTSFNALQKAALLLKDSLPYTLLIQGEKPKNVLIEEFIQDGHAVLLGTNSFWEGVDVKGASLSCVIIDKLPFASPSDPVLQARVNAMQQNGQDPFMEYQVPQAIIALKQGVGRLIRDEDDTGMVILGDPRLVSKRYGKLFLASLPPMRQVESFSHSSS